MTSTGPADPVIVLTTLGVDTDAIAFARTLVDERLAACVNVLAPMTSVYRWNESVEEDDERQLVIKTSMDRLEALKAHLLATHPYETPELLVVGASGSDAYLRWVGESTDSRR